MIPWGCLIRHQPPGRSPYTGAASGATLISQSGWSVRFVDSEETNQPGYLAANAIDGNPNTSWATPWFQVPGIPPPHEIQIDMGATHNVAGSAISRIRRGSPDAWRTTSSM